MAVGDRVRITAGGKTKDGKKLVNGTLFTVQGFNRRGDIVVDGGRVIDKEWGHLSLGYCVTSHASEGDTVDKVIAGISSQSLPATNERTAYVTVTRGREQAVVYTDDRKELLKAMERPDDPMSATELSDTASQTPSLLDRLKKLAFMRGQAAKARESHHRGLDHAG